MLLITKNEVTGHTCKELGLVMGNTVQTVHMGKDLMAGMKTLVGGEVKSYNEMMTKARNLATNRMIAEAEKVGADAIVGIRYCSDAVMASAAEILAYGTAVKFID